MYWLIWGKFLVAIWAPLEKVYVGWTILVQTDKHVIICQALMEMIPFCMCFITLSCIWLALLIKVLLHASGEGLFSCVVWFATEYWVCLSVFWGVEAKIMPESIWESSFGEVPRGEVSQERDSELGFCSTGGDVERSCRKTHIWVSKGNWKRKIS